MAAKSEPLKDTVSTAPTGDEHSPQEVTIGNWTWSYYPTHGQCEQCAEPMGPAWPACPLPVRFVGSDGRKVVRLCRLHYAVMLASWQERIWRSVRCGLDKE
jgi:hypothetical protein